MNNDARTDAVISQTLTRVGLLIGVPLAVVFGVQAFAWAAVTLKTWTTGETLKAADLNSNFDNINKAMPTVVQTTPLAGSLTIGAETAYTNYCPAQNVTIPTAGKYKVDGTWAGNGGSCPHASCIPLFNGVALNTGTDVWPGIISWPNNWYSSSVHGTVTVPAGTVSVQWQCHFNAACTGTLECFRFATILTGPF
jgi:hypothetical protein